MVTSGGEFAKQTSESHLSHCKYTKMLGGTKPEKNHFTAVSSNNNNGNIRTKSVFHFLQIVHFKNWVIPTLFADDCKRSVLNLLLLSESRAFCFFFGG